MCRMATVYFSVRHVIDNFVQTAVSAVQAKIAGRHTCRNATLRRIADYVS